MRRVGNIILCSKNDKGKKDREIYETGRAEITTAKGDTSYKDLIANSTKIYEMASTH